MMVAIEFLVTVSLMLLFWITLWKQNRIDSFQEDLYTIRDKFFDLKDSGRLDCDGKMLREFEDFINRFIRSGHTVNAFKLWLFWKNLKHIERSSPSDEFGDPVAKTKFGEIEMAVESAYVRFIVFTSLPLSFLFLGAFCWNVILFCFGQSSDILNTAARKAWAVTGAEVYIPVVTPDDLRIA